ncbi:MAG: L,D-transpeptidase, partial [Prevotella sp.]|nr:L,D-transpeptidase [Prevotella sp.]
MEAFSSLKTPSFVITPSEIRHHLHHIVKADTSKMISDRQVRAYYGDNNPFLWINRHGIDGRADSLLSYLERVGETGLKEAMFRKRQLVADIERIRNLDTSEQDNINALMARLEYNLTRAFLKYTAGQRYGYINPDKLFN